MSKEFLQGKVGTGVRAAWVGEKTTTSFAVYVLVRNMSSQAYNAIHDTSLNNVGTHLINTTNATIGCKNITTGVDVPVTGVDLTNDPLVHSDPDSRNWYGLRIRRFNFTGLKEGTNYTVEPYTNTVTANNPSIGTLKSFQFEVRTLSSSVISGMHYGCDKFRWASESEPNGMYLGFGDKPSWFDCADVQHDLNVDICVSQDDMMYSISSVNGPETNKLNWLDPSSLTSDTADNAEFYITGGRIRDAVLNVEEQTTDFQYGLVGEFFSAMLAPAPLATAMRASLESTDAGDHLATLNNTNFNIADDKFGLNTATNPSADNQPPNSAFLVDYGLNNLSGTKPTDTSTVNYLHGGSGSASVSDPFNPSTACYNNTITDLQSMATMQVNHKILMEYFFGRTTGVQEDGSASYKNLWTEHPLGVSGLNIPAYAGSGFWRKREHPLVDIIYLNTGYHADYCGNGIGDTPLNNPWTNLRAYPATNNETVGPVQKAWLINQVQNSTKDFIVIFCGDCVQPVNQAPDGSPGNAAGGIYGQTDGWGQTSRTEMISTLESLQAVTNKGILVLTSDHHTTCMTNTNTDQTVGHSNILQLLSVTGWGGALRRFTSNDTGFVGQYTDFEPANDRNSPRGISRFIVTEKEMVAYNIEAMIGNNLNSDVAVFKKGADRWVFEDRSTHKYFKSLAIGNGLASVKTN